MFVPFNNSLSHASILLTLRVVSGKLFQASVKRLVSLKSAYAAVASQAAVIAQGEPSRLSSIFMPPLAMRLNRVLSAKPFASQDVLAVGHRINMNRINTVANATEMVTLQVMRKFANEDLEHQSMHRHVFSANTDDAIEFGRLSAPPFPARTASVGVLLTDNDSTENSSEKFAVCGNSGKIFVRHIASTIGNLFRLGVVLVAPLRAVSILTQRRVIA